MAVEVPFSKYHGCGNDFIMVADMEGKYTNLFNEPSFVKKLCDRYVGIGGDALLHITKHEKYDFVMEDYTAFYGTPSGLCGNGSRCGIQFATDIGILQRSEGTFLASDGPHHFSIENSEVTINLSDISKDKIVKYNDDEYFMDVGSPHHVKFVHNIEEYDVLKEGPKIRFSDRYAKPDRSGNTGANVNFVEQLSNDKYRVRTYERTVEGETRACGTGSVSTAIAASIREKLRDKGSTAAEKKEHQTVIVNNGGNLTIRFTEEINKYSQVVLSGPAQKVFNGVYVSQT